MVVERIATNLIQVKVSQPYPIYLGEHLNRFIAETIKENKLAVISDTTVAPLYAEDLKKSLRVLR